MPSLLLLPLQVGVSLRLLPGPPADGGEGGLRPGVVVMVLEPLQLTVREVGREGPVEGGVPGLGVVDPQLPPVQQVGESLRPVPHDDPLPTAELTELEHDLGEVLDALLHPLELPVHHVDPVGLRLDHVLLYEAAKAGEVGGDGRDAHDGTLGRGVTPGLV